MAESDDVGEAAASAPPAELHLVESFANSLDVDTGKDDLATLADFRRWLGDHGQPATGVDAGALDRARAFRAALREELLRHHDPAATGGVPSGLAEAAAATPLVARFDPGGGVTLGATASDDRLVGTLLAGIVVADLSGTWRRLKLCPADDCLEAFYDRSRNHSRRWCSMGACGNRAKTRSFRARRVLDQGSAS